MNKIKWDRNSIVFKLMAFVLFLIVGQSGLLIVTMISVGVLKEAEEDAYQSFYEKVDNRKEYIEREMNNRWTNVEPYLTEISKLLPIGENQKEKSMDVFLKESAPILISMLRTTMTNGTFLILNDPLDNPDERLGLYLRDYDPLLNDDLNNDLYVVAGPFEISQMLRIPMDHSWSYNIELTKENRDFYDAPYFKAPLSKNSSLLGYWSPPFQFTANDLPIITYSMPIFDGNKELRGIIGIEILVDHFNQYLPATDLQPRDSLGYLIGYKEKDEEVIRPLITNGALQNRMLETDKEFIFQNKDEKRDIFLLENHHNKENIYASVQQIDLYNNNNPFEQEEWYLIGLMEKEKLLSFLIKTQNILAISFCGSIVAGGAGGYLISYVLTKPIINLAKQVKESDLGNAKSLNKTGFTEIDNLSHAIETANENLLESTAKLSRIIDLVDVPIGAFEFKKNEEKVFATDQLKQVLQFEEKEAEELYQNKNKFKKRLSKIMEKLEPDEENVYKISDSPDKWIRINMVNDENSTLGIVIDVTGEIQEKNQIKLDRDHDVLTKIYNRGAFERHVSRILGEGEGHLQYGACIMLDLDYLKQINDKYGHMWGDLYITTTADFLAVFREHGGIIGRLSGDEFSVFLTGFDSKEQIRELVRTYYQTLQSHPISFPEGDRQIMISGGLFWLDDSGQKTNNYAEVLEKADQALYHAKNNHKGSCCEYQNNRIIHC